MNTYIVEAWRGKSESAFMYGPLTESELDSFIVKLDEDNDIQEYEIYNLNDPSLFGSGEEIVRNDDY